MSEQAWVGNRELPFRYQGRPVMVRVEKGGVTFWLKGTRDKQYRPWKLLLPWQGAVRIDNGCDPADKCGAGHSIDCDLRAREEPRR